MGKAARWFKGLFGVKKGKERENANLNADSSDSINGDKRRSFAGKPGKGGADLRNQIQRNSITQADPAWFRSYLAETEEEQNKHAIAVAAATAAAADAAVAAAQAAVAVVRLTSNGRGAVSGGRREKFAAMKIQAFFRGYLARKAHRALKGLVKLQALVRGFLVRKRAAATLHSMQALIRAQTSVRSQRINRSLNNRDNNMFQSRRSIERYEDSRSEIHSKRMSAQFELNNNSHDENNPKIVEIDTYKPRSRSRRITIAAAAALSECGEEIIHYQENSPQDFDLCFNPDKLKFSTAQSTPRFSNPANFYPPPSPAKSVCGDGCFRPTNYGFTPSYMAKTQSFQAKLRSHSAPRQRPERKRLSLDEIMAARNSISGVKMQRSSCSSYYQYQEEDCRL